jgi:molybdopterin molybdotransferase
VAGQLAAGEVGAAEIRPGECVEIMTGGACPPGTHAVIPFEVTSREGTTLRVLESWKPQQNMALRGSECVAESILQQPGDLVTPLCTAVLASIGKTDVCVVPAPQIAILTTGGELVVDGARLGPAQIRDSNGPMVAAMCAVAGVPPARVAHVLDDRNAIQDAVEASSDCDLVILTGGVSTGKFDLVPAAIREAGGQLIFHKVSQKPGKPMLCAQRGRQFLFGLPGNPLAAHFCFHRYVATAIRGLSGHPRPRLPGLCGTLTTPVRANESRSWFVLGHAECSRPGGDIWQLQPLPSHSSADIFGARQANCYCEIPPGDRVRQAGESLKFEWLAEATGAPLT